MFYDHLDYAGTAETLRALVAERNPGASRLLDVACGTGRHLAALEGAFSASGGRRHRPCDAGGGRRRLPGVPLHEADMVDFDLGIRFDAVICMFSSIGYARTEERMRSAIASMARHLAPGGVLVVEPWLWPDMIQEPLVRGETIEGDGVVVARTSRMRIEGGVSTMEFAYLVTTAEGSETFVEEHAMGLFTPEQYTAAVEVAGLRAEFITPGPSGRGLAVGVRR